MIPDLILDVTSFLIYFIIALRIAPYVTVLAIIIGGVLFLLMRPLVVRVKNYSKGTIASQGSLASGKRKFYRA